MGFVDRCDISKLTRLIEEIDKHQSGFKDAVRGKTRSNQRLLCKLAVRKYYDVLDWDYIKFGAEK